MTPLSGDMLHPTAAYMLFSCRVGFTIDPAIRQGLDNLMFDLGPCWGVHSYECIYFQHFPKWNLKTINCKYSEIGKYLF